MNRAVTGERPSLPPSSGSGTASAAPRPRLAACLFSLASLLVGAMPVALVAAHRSSPLVLTLAASAALAGLWCEQGLSELARDLGRAVRTPAGLAGGAFLLWAGLSLCWSPEPRLSLAILAEFAGTVAGAAVLAAALPRRLPDSARALFLAGTGLAAALVLLDLWSDLAVRRALGLRVAYFVHNRPVLTLAALVAPAVALARGAPLAAAVTIGLVSLAFRRALGLRVAYFVHNRPVLTLAALVAPAVALASGAPLAAAVTLGLVVLAVSRAESGAAVLGLGVGAAFFLIARLAAGRIATGLAALALAVALVLAPVAGDLMAGLLPSAVHERLKGTSSRARVDIARSFGAAAREAPWIGQGFGASARLAHAPVAARVAPEFRTLLGVGHPHNAALQVWVELGLVGAMLALGALLLTTRSLSGLPREALAPRLGLLMGGAAVSLVGHGAWQGWWPAALGAAVVWLRFADVPNGKGP